MPVTENPIETLSSEVVFECPWYSVRQDALRLPGGVNGQYNVIQRPPSVFVVALPNLQHIVMVHVYRYPIKRWSWEIIAGSVEVGDTSIETAKKEFREETGGEANLWEHVCDYYPMTGVADELTSVYLAQDISMGQPDHEVTEIMHIHTLPLATVLIMIDTGEMVDALSISAILRTLRYLERNK